MEPLPREATPITLFSTLYKQKWLIIFTVLVSILIGVLVSTIPKKIYSVDSVIQIGNFPSRDGTVIPLGSISEIIEKNRSGTYRAIIADMLSVPETAIPEIQIRNTIDTTLLQLTVHSPDTQTALQVLSTMDELLVAEHKKLFEAKRAATVETIANIDQTIVTVKNRISPLYGSDNILSGLVTELSMQRDRLVNASETAVVKDPSISHRLVNHRLLFSLALAVCIGLFMGIFFALVKEWWSRSVRT